MPKPLKIKSKVPKPYRLRPLPTAERGDYCGDGLNWLFLEVNLGWPPASLSGHADSAWYQKSKVVKQHRHAAHVLTKVALRGALYKPEEIARYHDMGLAISFVPPDLRGDRTNFANRMKPYIDGIADALEINDRVFLPSYSYAEPDRNDPYVSVRITMKRIRFPQ